MALPIQPYKGTRDFYPADWRLMKYIFNVWRASAEKFGYEEYNAPLLELLEIYQAKTGDEIVNEQTYGLTDRGGRQVVIRPEMTPSVSRLVAARRQELAYPLRLYSLPNLWRYEQPQKGRLREHWQLNVDLFGVADVRAEYELLSVIADIFSSFGASQSDYQIRLNSRSLSDHILTEYLGLSETQTVHFRRLIDKSAKLSKADFEAAAQTIVGESFKNIKNKLDELFEADKCTNLAADLANHASAKELTDLTERLAKADITNVRFDFSIMRGFDYYTDIVFEVFDTHPDNNRSMVAGGRYDGLVGLFGVADLPTAGFGWGDVTMTNFLQLHDLIPDLKPEVDVYLALIDVRPEQAESFVKQLREAGLRVAVDFSDRRLGDQLKVADKKGLRYVCIMGADELASGQLTLKDLGSGEEKKLSPSEIVKAVRAGSNQA